MNLTILALLLAKVSIMSSIFRFWHVRFQSQEEQDRQVCPMKQMIWDKFL